MNRGMANANKTKQENNGWTASWQASRIKTTETQDVGSKVDECVWVREPFEVWKKDG